MIPKLGVFFLIQIIIATKAFDLELAPTALLNMKTGDNLMVSCAIQGVQISDGDEVDMRWVGVSTDGVERKILDDGRVHTQSKDRDMLNLVIVKAEMSDVGTYKCIATVKGETVEKSIPLNLLERIEFADCKESQHPVSGKKAELSCRLKVISAAPEVQWYKEGKQLHAGGPRGYAFEENNNLLIIPNYDPKLDDGTYSVQVIQKLTGNVEFKTIETVGHTEPEIQSWSSKETGYEGMSLDLPCIATGKPTPTFVWRKGNTKLTSTDKYTITDGKLSILALAPEDAGRYTCTAENDVGDAEEVVEVSVFLKPKIRDMSNLTISSGSNAELRCEYSGHGDMTSYWKFRGELFAPKEESDNEVPTKRMYATKESTEKGEVLILHINGLEMQDAGVYECEVKNVAGSDTKTLQLAVTHAPMLEERSEEVIRVVSGQEVVLFCKVTAVPIPKWRWYQGEDLITPDGRDLIVENSANGLMTILKMTADAKLTYGEYGCEADNGVAPHLLEKFHVVEVVKPPMPNDLTANDRQHPNYAEIEIGNYEELTEGSRPTNITFFFAEETTVDDADDFEWETMASQTVVNWNEKNLYQVTGMRPETSYYVTAMAANEAGASQRSPNQISYRTTAPLPPAAPSFVEEKKVCDSYCEIRWSEPNDHGSNIKSYQLAIVPVQLNADGGDSVPVGGVEYVNDIKPSQRSYKTYDLMPKTSYRFTLVAINDIGEGSPAVTIMTTSESGWNRGAGVSTAVIIVLVIIVLIVVVVLIDLLCYFMNNCGIIMSICVNCCGKTPPEVKAKEIAMEEARKSGEEAALKEKEPLDEKTINEATPMIYDSEKPGKKDTVV